MQLVTTWVLPPFQTRCDMVAPPPFPRGGQLQEGRAFCWSWSPQPHTHTHTHTHTRPPWGPGHVVGCWAGAWQSGSECRSPVPSSAGCGSPLTLRFPQSCTPGFSVLKMFSPHHWPRTDLSTEAQCYSSSPFSLPEPPPLQAVYSFLLAPLEHLPILRTLVCFPDSISWTVCFLFPSLACCLAWCLLNNMDSRSAAFMFQTGETW